MSAPTIAFYRYLTAALVLLPFLLRLGREHRAAVAWGTGSGAVMGLGWIGYVSALEAAPVAAVGVFYMSYPVFTLLIGWGVFGDRPGRRAALGAALILAAVLAAAPSDGEPISAWAILAALAAPFGFGCAINVLTRKLAGVPPLSLMAIVSGGAVLGLSPLVVLVDGAGVLPSSVDEDVLILGVTVATALLPQLLYVVHAPAIGPTRTAMAGSVELPTMFAVGWLMFGEALTFKQVAAGALVLMAIVVTPTRRVQNVTSRLTDVPE